MIKQIVQLLLCAATSILPSTSTVSAEPPSSGGTISYRLPKQLAELRHRDIAESSGLAVSHLRADTFWTHNDSGDKPRIFAFDRQGRHWAEFLVPGARAVDWEDMASFVDAGQSYLVLGDVGDNAKRRPHCTLYIVAEPANRKQTATLTSTIRFKYEDGPVDCEALAVDPTTKEVLLVSKVFGLSCSVYRLSLSRPNSARIQIARCIARIPYALVTAMDISPDGRRAVVLTYGPAYEYSRKQGESWPAAFLRKPSTITMPHRRQGEAICYSKDGTSLYLTSEGIGEPFWEVAAVGER